MQIFKELILYLSNSIKVVKPQQSNVKYERKRMMGFIIDFYLIPSFFRADIIHSTIVACIYDNLN